MDEEWQLLEMAEELTAQQKEEEQQRRRYLTLQNRRTQKILLLLICANGVHTLWRSHVGFTSGGSARSPMRRPTPAAW